MLNLLMVIAWTTILVLHILAKEPSKFLGAGAMFCVVLLYLEKFLN